MVAHFAIEVVVCVRFSFAGAQPIIQRTHPVPLCRHELAGLSPALSELFVNALSSTKRW